MVGGRRLIGLLAAGLIAGCGVQGADEDQASPRAEGWTTSGGSGETVLVRGRIATDTLVIEPVFRLDAPPSVPDEGRHRLRGLDESGQVVFDVRFDGVEAMPAGGGTAEEHFNLSVPVGAGGAVRLHRVELLTADGRMATRVARHSRQELLTLLEAPDAVLADRVAEDRVRVRWDADRFPAVVVRDAATLRILSIARGGDITVTAEGSAVEVIVSEGVRSAVRRFPPDR